MDVKLFQKRYVLTNKDMAHICQCSLPTIQKWRSQEVPPSGPASQLMRLLDQGAQGDPHKIREILSQMDRPVATAKAEKADSRREKVMDDVVDRLELMLETRRRERRLAESEARYKAMLEYSRDAVCRWLPDTTLTYANAAYKEIFNRPGEDLVGRKWIEFVPEARRQSVMMIVNDIVRRGEPEAMEHESIDKDGTVRWQQWRDVPVKDERGQVVELHSIGRDVSEIKELKRRADRWERMAGALLKLGGQAVLSFDQNGRILEANNRFRDLSGGATPWRSLDEMTGTFPMGRFKQLLKRLGESDQIQYQIRIQGRAYTMHVRHLQKSGKDEHFLGMIEPLQTTRPLMDIRLANEVIVGGRKVDFALQPDHRALLDQQMQQIGQDLRLDRISVFTVDRETGLGDNILEWCNDGVESHIDELSRISMEPYEWWNHRIQNKQLIKIEDVDHLPRTAVQVGETMRAQSLQAAMSTHLEFNGEVIGFVIFGQTRHTRVWHKQEVRRIEDFATMASALVGEVLAKRKRS
jgi:PAS domain S-box-containing protein